MATSTIQFVCVSNDRSVYDMYIGRNPYIQQHQVYLYDNSADNVAITIRYNHFIKEKMLPDTWVVFLHHDMVFYEDPALQLSRLSTGRIYGPTGACLEVGKAFIAVTGEKLTDLSVRVGRVREYQHYGRIGCLPHISSSGECGLPVDGPTDVQTLDCCCLVVHSSLIRRYDLRFEERLDWHLYAEDFCLTAWQEHGIGTQVVQFKCGHYGKGGQNAAFLRCRDVFLGKHRGKRFATTVGIRPGEKTHREIEQDSRWNLFF